MCNYFISYGEFINTTYECNDKGIRVYTELSEFSELLGLRLCIVLGRDTGFDEDLLSIGDIILPISNSLLLTYE